MKRSIVFGLILAAAISCNQVDIDKEISQIDSLSTLITKAEEIMLEVNIDTVKTLQEQMSNQVMLAKSLYGDSIEWEKAKLLSKYYVVNKSFKKYIDKEIYLRGELKFSKHQLADLSADLENNIIPPDSFIVYFEKECKAVSELTDLIQKEVSQTKISIDSYEEMSSNIKVMLEGQRKN